MPEIGKHTFQAFHKAPESDTGLWEHPLPADTDTGVRARNYPTMREAYAAAKEKKLAKAQARAQAFGSIDVRAIRLHLRLTQDAFARTFGLTLDAVRQWESGRRKPEGPAQVLLAVIADDHTAVLRALDHAPALPQLASPHTALRRGRPRKAAVKATAQEKFAAPGSNGGS